jgi:AraC family transcriptional regulator of adaptative response / DNA-3-methyladenine glycosylase II
VRARSTPASACPVRGIELAVRAILGQQVSVAAATTMAGRVAEMFGGGAAELANAPLEHAGIMPARAAIPTRFRARTSCCGAAGERSAHALEARAEAWRPWRAYAAMLL